MEFENLSNLLTLFFFLFYFPFYFLSPLIFRLTLIIFFRDLSGGNYVGTIPPQILASTSTLETLFGFLFFSFLFFSFLFFSFLIFLNPRDLSNNDFLGQITVPQATFSQLQILYHSPFSKQRKYLLTLHFLPPGNCMIAPSSLLFQTNTCLLSCIPCLIFPLFSDDNSSYLPFF